MGEVQWWILCAIGLSVFSTSWIGGAQAYPDVSRDCGVLEDKVTNISRDCEEEGSDNRETTSIR